MLEWIYHVCPATHFFTLSPEQAQRTLPAKDLRNMSGGTGYSEELCGG